MYNNRNSRPSYKWGNNQNNNSGSSQGRRGYGGRARAFGGGNGRPSRKSFSKHIDTSLFIKKAVEFVTIEDTPTKHSFEDFNLNPILLENIKSKGFVKPTPIQDETIPEILNGRDILGIANTGTGKTAAFALPLINKILENPNKRIIILAPTRELAQQIKQDIRSFTPGLKVYLALAIGGSFMREQIQDIRRGPHIIVGTPGRIKDLGSRGVIRFHEM
ncbi:MAG TPA: DEAD/DEAH box helicase, partial [Patescibacteria group bacterium]